MKIWITYTLRGESVWDGQTPCPPVPGDWVEIDGETYEVLRRRWVSNESYLGADACRTYQVPDSGIQCVIVELKK